ncbi:MAG: diacylglycerol kinase, partial [Spirochaetaceae bacterium]|nr:diacylglycerol kinase [Spirochaetaceae bacterium]
MRPEELASSLQRLVERSPAFPDEELVVDLIANPKAGGFTRLSYAKLRHRELLELEARAAALPPRRKPAGLRLHLTERCGHAADIARGILAEARKDPPGRRRLVLTAGGDGTSLEAASALVELPPEERGRFALLRLPFGTGNDGSEGRDLLACLGRFLEPCAAVPKRAVLVEPNPAGGKLPSYSFNIVSLGLDAFVCEMTNRLKSVLPGDSYKLWVDVASVFYDLRWPPAPLKARAFDAAGAETVSFERPCLLVAFGAGGNRQYGCDKPILPDDDNVCAVFLVSLLKKLAFKDRIASGRHRGLGEDILKLFSAERIVFDYSRGILMQRDGEVT